MAASRWMGRGDKNGADGAAVDAMRIVLDTVPMDGIVVIGEGEKDEAPMLYNGEQIGDGTRPPPTSPSTPSTAPRSPRSAGATPSPSSPCRERGTMFNPGPCVYMEKIAVGPEAQGRHRHQQVADREPQRRGRGQGRDGPRPHRGDPRPAPPRRPHRRGPRGRGPHPPHPRRRRGRRHLHRLARVGRRHPLRHRRHARGRHRRRRPQVHGRRACRAGSGPATTRSGARPSTPATTSTGCSPPTTSSPATTASSPPPASPTASCCEGVHYQPARRHDPVAGHAVEVGHRALDQRRRTSCRSWPTSRSSTSSRRPGRRHRRPRRSRLAGVEGDHGGLHPAHAPQPALAVAGPALLVGGDLGVGEDQEPLRGQARRPPPRPPRSGARMPSARRLRRSVGARPAAAGGRRRSWRSRPPGGTGTTPSPRRRRR